MFFLNVPILRWISRRFFYIHGDRSDVGNKDILRIFPHAIEWKNRDETYSMEFRTGDKFARRLYHGLYWLWYCIHMWDMLVNALQIPQYNLGFDSLTFRGSDVGSAGADGSVERSVVSESFATIRAGAGTGFNKSSALYASPMLSSVGATSGNYGTMRRALYNFLTSSLPDTANITVGTFSIYGNGKSNTMALSNAQAAAALTGNTPSTYTDILAADYAIANFGSTRFASDINYDLWSTTSFNSFDLNTAGKLAISLTSYTGFSVRIATEADNTDPGGAVDTSVYYTNTFLNQSGTSEDPVLVVTYTLPPTVTTSAASSVQALTAVGNGNVTSDGGAAITERGFAYATTSNPTVSDNKLIVSGTTGAYSGTLTGLNPSTLYHIRAYAINSVGTSYGSDVTFTTTARTNRVPRLTTSPVIQNITRNKVTLTGEVTSDGDNTITERGFTFGTSRGTTVLNDKKVISGTTGIFSGQLENLTAGTRYYARAYATNSIGTGYGNEVTFIMATRFVTKHYFYKIYQDDIYMTTWTSEVVSDPSFMMDINSGPGELFIKLARRFDEFNEGTDIALNNRVECWVADEDRHDAQLLYSGYISGYRPIIEGVTEFIEITVFNYAAALSRTILRDSTGNTTLAYLSVDPAVIMRDVIDKYVNNGGRIGYTSTSIVNTGYTVTYTFNTNTLKECLDKILELCPEGWYYIIDSDSTVYLRPKSGTSDNKFYIGKHVKMLGRKKRIENLINRVLFIGDNLYRVYQDQTSINLYGIHEDKIIDQRVSVAATAQIMSNRLLNMNKDPEVQMQLVIMDNNGPNIHRGYDIESVKPGQTLQVFNPISTLLQILSVQYLADSIVIEASSRIPVVAKRVEDIRRNFELYQTADNPSIPVDI